MKKKKNDPTDRLTNEKVRAILQVKELCGFGYVALAKGDGGFLPMGKLACDLKDLPLLILLLGSLLREALSANADWWLLDRKLLATQARLIKTLLRKRRSRPRQDSLVRARPRGSSGAQ